MERPDLHDLVKRHIERSLDIVKRDGLSRGLCGELLRRIERTGLALIGLKMITAARSLAEQHYTYEDIYQ